MTRENALKIFKSLSDMSRLRIVQALTEGEMYTELLAERLGLTPSTVSFHMKKLEDAGIVISRKEQYYTVYSLNRDVLETSLFDAAAAEPEQVDEQQRREKNPPGIIYPQPNYLETELNIPFRQNRFL